MTQTRSPAVAEVFFAGKDSLLGGIAIKSGAPTASFGGNLQAAASIPEAVAGAAGEMGATEGGLLTLYYGGAQKEREAREITANLAQTFDGIEVEYYYGGQRACEYVMSLER
jgi:dihydroxyacetone kinase-like predicted kinase